MDYERAWVESARFLRERNGALLRVQVEVRSKQLDTADIVREGIYRELSPEWFSAIRAFPQVLEALLSVCRGQSRIALIGGSAGSGE